MGDNPFANLGGILKQAAKLKENVAAVQKELARKEVEASAGGGMVTVRMNGVQQIISMRIDPEVVRPEEREMLEDLISAAVNEAVKRSQELMKEEIGKAAGGLNLPGLFS